jgi:outer membrane protein assembly factor BamA
VDNLPVISPTRARYVIRGLSCLCAFLSVTFAPALAQQGVAGNPIPSFKELETAGAVIGEIRINSQNIFDLDNPKENNLFYRLGNAIHVPTRVAVLRSVLLFKSGEPVSARVIEETERLLRAQRYLYDVSIRPVAYRDGVVDIEVATRDSWSLDPAIKLTRQGGANSGGIGLKEQNLLGTGVFVGFARESEVDRSGNEFSIGQDNLFGSRTAIEYRNASFSDGERDAFRLERPFYALDTRWAAGVTGVRQSRVDSIYSGGVITSQYRRQADAGQVYGGFSPGLVNGFASRYSAGVEYRNDAYRTDPTLLAPSELPQDQKLVAPFVRYELVEDDFRKTRNLERVERTEYLQMGANLRLQLGHALTGLGSSRDLWLYEATGSNGFTLGPRDTVIASAYANGQHGDDGGEHQFFGTGAKYYHRQAGGNVFYAAAAADAVADGDTSDNLLLGGDSGLRGYPQRYQNGTRRALFTLEQRYYTDWYPFRLFRVGAVAFLDTGRAWGGDNPYLANPGWLTNVGFGLRIFSDRSASGRVLHIDFAFPLDSDPAIRSSQVIFKSRASF